ncbi:carbonic anhydrase 5B, mitochondrial-like isoform X3 [Moschus berezovskii]|uniref:carbonic anhydrase 5B, mitochondrial-like isoform X3 n=1 Tax=Moschus berezovskii TaxID=68408 RepID=UPI002443D10A|nr:carbonic anhydrase 5B, mitochondrial-like isoform X3 [Moschus berezovskii]
MAMMSHLRAILQASPCKTLEKVPDSEVHACKALQPLHLHLKSRNQVLHPLWEKVDLAPAGERQSPINIRWRDSVYDPGLQPLTISYDPTTCLHVWNNGYSFLVEFEDSADKSGMLPSEVPRLATDSLVRVFPGVSKLLSF